MTEPSRIHSGTFVKCKRVLDRKVDRNADTLQQTITDAGEQDPAPGATGRTATNSHEQPMPNPPFGMPSKILGPPVQLKSLLEQLERICVGDISSIDSNLTANVTLGLSHRTSIHSSRPLSATRAPKVRLLPRSAEENRYTRFLCYCCQVCCRNALSRKTCSASHAVSSRSR